MDGVKALQSDCRIQFDMRPHRGCALDDGLFKRFLSARINILFGEVLFGFSCFRDRFLQGARDAIAASRNTGFIQMHMTIDKAAHHQFAVEFFGCTIALDMGGNIGD